MFVVRCSLFVGCQLSVVRCYGRCWLIVVCRSVFVVVCSSVVNCCLLFALVACALFVVCCVLFVGR